MDPQLAAWTCSVCSFTWVINALAESSGQVPYITRQEAGSVIGYPDCVNETYGCMSAQCLMDAFSTYGLESRQAWVTFEQAYAVMHAHTGVINPVGMYHFMACRGVTGNQLSVANSAEGYMNVWSTLNRNQFNALGPVQMIYLPETSPG